MFWAGYGASLLHKLCKAMVFISSFCGFLASKDSAWEISDPSHVALLKNDPLPSNPLII